MTTVNETNLTEQLKTELGLECEIEDISNFPGDSDAKIKLKCDVTLTPEMKSLFKEFSDISHLDAHSFPVSKYFAADSDAARSQICYPYAEGYKAQLYGPPNKDFESTDECKEFGDAQLEEIQQAITALKTWLTSIGKTETLSKFDVLPTNEQAFIVLRTSNNQGHIETDFIIRIIDTRHSVVTSRK